MDKMADGQPCAFCDFKVQVQQQGIAFVHQATLCQHTGMIDIREGDYLMFHYSKVERLSPAMISPRVCLCLIALNF